MVFPLALHLSHQIHLSSSPIIPHPFSPYVQTIATLPALLDLPTLLQHQFSFTLPHSLLDPYGLLHTYSSSPLHSISSFLLLPYSMFHAAGTTTPSYNLRFAFTPSDLHLNTVHSSSHLSYFIHSTLHLYIYPSIHSNMRP